MINQDNVFIANSSKMNKSVEDKTVTPKDTSKGSLRVRTVGRGD